MVASLVLCHISFSTGRTNVLNGAQPTWRCSPPI